MARAYTILTLVAANTSSSGSGTERVAGDVRDSDGGFLTLRIKNSGALGAQCVCTVMVAHDTGSTPTEAATGDTSAWKQVFQFGGGTVSGTITTQVWEFGPSVTHIQVEFTGHTTNAVIVEAIATLVDYEA
jgi:hypothetical protein